MAKDIVRDLIGDGREFFRFVESNRLIAPDTLRLRYAGANSWNFDPGFAIDQIESRRKTCKKLPAFLRNEKTLFPAVVSSEQASDQGVAAFHGRLAAGSDRVADLTAGLGIDAMAMADVCGSVCAVELDPLRHAVLEYNVDLLGKKNVTAVCADCFDWLREQNRLDLIFIDPARRGENNRRTYAFADCQPDIPANIRLLLDKADRILIKASPLLDIRAVLGQLENVTRIWAVGRHGECKELLIELRRDGVLESVSAVDVDIHGNGEEFVVPTGELTSAEVRYADFDPAYGMWVYEPSAVMMKIGAWGEICRRWPELMKVGRNSHLFVSRTKIDGFPGKQLAVEDVVKAKDLRRFKGGMANVVTRNYPLTSAELRKKAGVREGGHAFIIGTRWGACETPVILLTDRISD